jgi:hypothetical protein
MPTNSRSFLLHKLKHSASEHNETLQYYLAEFHLNDLLGKPLGMSFTGNIFCIACGRKISKSFNQGYCFPCFKKLAACDLCILKPTLCHFAQGTCREPDWAEQNCLQEHYVYLANSTNLKVGLTRKKKCFERWGDQGACQSIVIAEVPERKIAGDLEALIARNYSDKTDWRKLTTSNCDPVDLSGEAEKVIKKIPSEYQEYLLSKVNRAEKTYQFSYPILGYPKKSKTHDFHKNDNFSAKLIGIKGQYLLFEDFVINIRKYQGYEVSLASDN